MLEDIKHTFKSKKSSKTKLHRIYSDLKTCKMLYIGDFWEIIHESVT
jgi:hypothetical protein